MVKKILDNSLNAGQDFAKIAGKRVLTTSINYNYKKQLVI